MKYCFFLITLAKIKIGIVLARILKKEYLRIVPFKEDKSTVVGCVSKNSLKQLVIMENDIKGI